MADATERTEKYVRGEKTLHDWLLVGGANDRRFFYKDSKSGRTYVVHDITKHLQGSSGITDTGITVKVYDKEGNASQGMVVDDTGMSHHKLDCRLDDVEALPQGKEKLDAIILEVPRER